MIADASLCRCGVASSGCSLAYRIEDGLPCSGWRTQWLRHWGDPTLSYTTKCAHSIRRYAGARSVGQLGRPCQGFCDAFRAEGIPMSSSSRWRDHRAKIWQISRIWWNGIRRQIWRDCRWRSLAPWDKAYRRGSNRRICLPRQPSWWWCCFERICSFDTITTALLVHAAGG